MAEDTRLSGFSTEEKVGFVGLGVMGQPMALNLAKAGARLIVWNRTPERTDLLRDVGAVVAHGAEEVFAGSRIVILMLINEAVIDTVLDRGTPGFAELVCDHIVVSMGSTAPDYSRALAAERQCFQVRPGAGSDLRRASSSVHYSLLVPPRHPVRVSLVIAGVLTPTPSDAPLSVIRDLTRELEP